MPRVVQLLVLAILLLVPAVSQAGQYNEALNLGDAGPAWSICRAWTARSTR